MTVVINSGNVIVVNISSFQVITLTTQKHQRIFVFPYFPMARGAHQGGFVQECLMACALQT